MEIPLSHTFEGSPKLIRVLVYNGIDLLDLSGPLEVFSVANIAAASLSDADSPSAMLADARERPAYSIELVSIERSLKVETHSGVAVQANTRLRGLSEQAPADTLLVPGGDMDALLTNWSVLSLIRRSSAKARRTASVCSGALVLAAAGVLNGRKATTHWLACDVLSSLGRNITTDADAIFVRDGEVWTSAGGTAGIDLTLAMVEDDLGRDVAMMVARLMVMPLRRQGGQSQFSPLLKAQSVKEDTLRDTLDWAAANLREDLRVEVLAERACMSPRNFARVFARQLGETPGKFVERLRTDTAQRLLERTDKSLSDVADECGFGSADSMRRAFLRLLKVSPDSYRSQFK